MKVIDLKLSEEKDMSEEQIQKLNRYFNDVFLMLEKKDSYLLHNIRKFVFASESYAEFADDVNFEEEAPSTYLTFEEVYALGREIIASICPCYLEEYNQILANGILNFDYENEYDGSYCYCNCYKQEFEVNINRRFSYRDIIVLIHEFMHYTNGKKIRSENRHLLTEFISIYFETKAVIYLIEEKQIFPNEVLWNERLKLTRKDANAFNWYSFPLTMYVQFGKIDSNSGPKLIHYLSPYTTNKEIFTKECMNFLNKMEKLEDAYYKEYPEEKRNSENWIDYIHRYTSYAEHYHYILGTILAFYALEHCNVVDMIKLNNIISSYSDEDYEEEYGMENLLYGIGIDVNHSKTLNEALESMKHFNETYGNKKKR